MEKHAADCGEALHELRELIRDGLVKHKPSDIERATGTLIGHLVDMELVSAGIKAVQPGRGRLGAETDR